MLCLSLRVVHRKQGHQCTRVDYTDTTCCVLELGAFSISQPVAPASLYSSTTGSRFPALQNQLLPAFKSILFQCPLSIVHCPGGCAMAIVNELSAGSGQHQAPDMVIGVDFGMTQTGSSFFIPSCDASAKSTYSRSFVLFSTVDESKIIPTLVGKCQ